MNLEAYDNPTHDGWWWVKRPDLYQQGDEICVEIRTIDGRQILYYGPTPERLSISDWAKNHKWWPAQCPWNPSNVTPDTPKFNVDVIGIPEVLEYLRAQDKTRRYAINRADDDPAAHIALSRGAAKARKKVTGVMCDVKVNRNETKKVNIVTCSVYDRVVAELYCNMTDHSHKFQKKVDHPPYTELDFSVDAEFLIGLLEACQTEESTAPLEHFFQELIK